MTLPTSDTIVDYPDGATSGAATVLHTAPHSGALAVLLDRTPVHPVDAGWPDQGPDDAVLRIEGADLPLLDCVVGATDGTDLFVGAEVPVRKGTEGWAFVVVHLVAGDARIGEGDTVEAIVDPAARRALSVGHTACHVASLALNRALAGAWRKTPRLDAAGAPDFDQVAIETSTITPNGSIDAYRVGRSVRKAGFDPEALADPSGLALEVAATVTSWVSSGGSVRIDRDGDGLGDRRSWVCDLPDGEVRIPCGGTHVESLRDLGDVTVSLTVTELDGALGLTMTTRAAG